MNASENETHAIIRLSKGAFCQSLNILMTDKGVLAPKNLPARALNVLQLVDQPEFSINGNFSSAKGFLDVDVHKGSWEEIMLAEVELSFTDAPYNISCKQEQIEFTIGLEEGSQIQVQARAEGGFDVTYTVVKAPEQKVIRTHFFDEKTAAAEIMRRLYGRIKGRVKGEGFAERQAQYQEENTKNLNKTMLDSFVDES